MTNSPFFRSLIIITAFSICIPALAYDSEWPPVEDAYDNTAYVPPEIALPVVAANIPAEFKDWMRHSHSEPGWGDWPVDYQFGDVDGVDNGELHCVISVADEVVAAMEVNIDWEANPPTMSLVPIWAILLPFAKDSANGGLGGLPPIKDPGETSEEWNDRNELLHAAVGGGRFRTNLAIWDFDGDGYNEVVLGARVYEGGAWEDSIAALRQYKPGEQAQIPPQNEWDFSVEPAKELDYAGTGTLLSIGDRVGLARVRNTPHRQDIVSHCHVGNTLGIWKLENDQLSLIYHMNDFVTGQPQGICITHEFNNVDTDGDGFDEFMHDGILDFVDNDGYGNPVPTNGIHGVRRWVTGLGFSPPNNTYDHTDQQIAANWDGQPGLEILGIPEFGWWDEYGVEHPLGTDTMWAIEPDANGKAVIIRENTDAPPRTQGHPQTIYGGNWTSSADGFEAIFFPKGWNPAMFANGDPLGAGGYAVDALQNELVIAGVRWAGRTTTDPLPDTTDPVPRQRAGGPGAPPGGQIMQIDWDGDYVQDEILNRAWHCNYIWSMREKGTWEPGNEPAGMPQDYNDAVSAWQELGLTLHWYWFWGNYEGDQPGWGWNNGGAGPYTHYYEKLGEVFTGGWSQSHVWDLGRDYREEATNMTPWQLKVFYNDEVLATPARHPSPVTNLDYRRHRIEAESCKAPFDYQTLPAIARIEVTPKTLGMPLNSWDTLTATAVYSDGSNADVTDLVTWVPDSDLNAFITLNQDGSVLSGAWQASIRVHATLNTGGEEPLKSNDAIVFCTDEEKPFILTAGYQNTYLQDGVDSGFKVTARVAQRDNVPVWVYMKNPVQGTDWQPFGATVYLFDLGTNGDDEANDGIYTAVLQNPTPGVGNGLNLGDNLKWLTAVFHNGNDWVFSDAWPYFTVGVASYPDITGQYADGDLFPELKPTVLSCGTRGVQVLSNHLFIEAQVARPLDDYLQLPVHVFAFLPWDPGNPRTLVDKGDGIYVHSELLSPMPPDGVYVIHVQAAVEYQGLLYFNDAWPRLRIHP